MLAATSSTPDGSMCHRFGRPTAGPRILPETPFEGPVKMREIPVARLEGNRPHEEFSFLQEPRWVVALSETDRLYP